MIEVNLTVSSIILDNITWKGEQCNGNLQK